MSWGDRIALANVLLGCGASVGYLCASDWRRGIYWFLGASITATANWLIR
jgi:hypothetical protein